MVLVLPTEDGVALPKVSPVDEPVPVAPEVLGGGGGTVSVILFCLAALWRLIAQSVGCC